MNPRQLLTPLAMTTLLIATSLTAHAQSDSTKGGIFGGGASDLLGSWLYTEDIDIGTDIIGFEATLTFTGNRFTATIFIDAPPELLAGLPGFVADMATETGTYTVDTSANPDQLTLTTETTFEPTRIGAVDTAIFEIVGDTLRIVGPDFDTGVLPTSFDGLEFVAEYARIGEQSSCLDSVANTLAANLATFQAMTGVSDDFDNDGIPESALIELFQFVVCGNSKVPNRVDISDAAQSAFLVNLAALQQAGAGDLANIGALLAIAGITSQAELQTAFAGLGITVPDGLAFVTCDANTCRADGNLPNPVFSGAGDLDDDGTSNAAEFAASGGDIDAFLDDATDNIPNFNAGRGCAAASGGTPAREAGDWLLMVLAVVGLALASRVRVVRAR